MAYYPVKWRKQQVFKKSCWNYDNAEEKCLEHSTETDQNFHGGVFVQFVLIFMFI